MGREVKRVALDFQWPLNDVWRGYINPHAGPDTCRACGGDGYAPEANKLANQWYGRLAHFSPELTGSEPFTKTTPEILALARRSYSGEAVLHEADRLVRIFNSQWCHHLDADDVAALVKAERLVDFTHDWTPDKGWQPKDPPVVPTPRQVNLWSLRGFGHDAINRGVCVEAKCERLGHPLYCSSCEGDGHIWFSAAAKELYEAWEEEEPPAGEGWQMWETTSEGSPISPVCESPEALARWLHRNGASAFGGDTATYEQWLAMIDVGSAPSMVGGAEGLQSGVAAVAASKLPD